MKRLLQTLFCAALVTTASAQLSTNPDKFLGNITTRYSMDAGGGVPQYYKLWNQVTPENESKWSSVQGGGRNSWNWGGADNAFNYAKNHNFTYKFHAFLWGSQYPGWLESLSIKDRFEAVETWFNGIRSHYSHLPMVDVVNEAIGNHQPGNPLIKSSVGGGGKTGYDWLVKAFEMAYERFPNSILIYNDFNSIHWEVDAYITLVQAIRDAGAPIDAYGNQAHDVSDISQNELKNAIKKQQDALKMPMFITELDIDIADDAKQEAQYKNIFPSMWEAEYCAGVTLWGYVFGATWVSNSGLYRGSAERPAMKWLKDYMVTDKAKTAKSPYPGMKKRMGVYIKPADFKVAKNDVLPVKVRTHITDEYKKENPNIAIEKVELFAGTSVSNATTLVATMTEAPYICEYTVPSTTGYKVLRAVVTCNDGATYERFGRINVLSSSIKREPYNGTPIEIPGTINIAEYDKGASGVTYTSPCYDYSKRATISETKDNAWMEYTVDVKEDGLYKIEAEVASAKEGGTFHLTEYGLDSLTFIANMLEVPLTGSSHNYRKIYAVCKNPLSAGKHHICLNVDKGGFYIKNITFKPYKQNKDIQVEVSSLSSSSITEGGAATIDFTASVKNNAGSISSVVVYVNDEPVDTLTEAPYTVEYAPTERGTFVIKAVAFDSNGAENSTTSSKTLTVKALRAPYDGIIELPGIIEAENFDHGDDNMSYHDSDLQDQGNAKYRTDNGGVDIIKGNGGYAVGYTSNGEWLEYTVNVTKSGKYNCYATASASADGAKFYVLRYSLTGASTVLWQFDVPKSSTYKKIDPSPINNATTTLKQLTEGEQRIRIRLVGSNCNIDKIEIKPEEETGIDDVENDVATPAGSPYNLSGQKVGDGYRGIIVRNGQKMLRK